MPRRPIINRTPDRVRRKSSAAPWIAGGVVVALLVGGLLVGMLWSMAQPRRRPPVRWPDPAVAEDEQRRRDEVRHAFRNQQPADDELVQELKPLFDGLAKAFHARDQQQLMAHFDAERLFDELVAHDGLPAVGRNRRQEVEGLRGGIGRALQQAPLLGWTVTEIRNVKKLEGNEAVVIGRHRTNDGVWLKMRWWVAKRQGVWKVYDMEDLDMSLRLSTTMVGFLQEGFGRLPNVTRGAAGVRDALHALAFQQDVDTAERRLKDVAAIKLPSKLEACRWLVAGLVHFNHGRHQEALDAFEKANGFHADMPCLDLFRGMVFNQMAQWDRALKHLQAYHNLLGDEALTCREMGFALSGLRRFPEACASYRKALDDDPKDADSFLYLLRALEPEAKRDDVPERFARLDALHENFDIFAEDCRQAHDGEGIEDLVRAMRKIDPGHVPVDYYQAVARAWAGKSDEAGPLIRGALIRGALTRERDPARRQSYLQGFFQAMTTAGKTVDAYAAVPDSREAFRFLAAELQRAHRVSELKRLTALHGQKHADDPLLPFYQGEVYVQEQRFKQADQVFSVGMAKPPEPDVLHLFRSSRVLARYHTGQALAALAEIGPRTETFQQLGFLCLDDDSHALLQSLLEAQAKADPADDSVLRFRVRLKAAQGQTAEAVAAFKAALAKQANDEQRQELTAEFLADMAEAGKPLEGYAAVPDARQAFQLLANELHDLGRRDDLRKLLEAHRRRHPDDFWLSLQEADLLIDEGIWGRAAELLTNAMKKAPDEVRGQQRWKYVWVMYKAGLWLQVYHEDQVGKATFEQLVRLLIQDRRQEELEALLNAHGPLAEDDPDLLQLQARVLLLRKQPDAAIALFQKAYQRLTVDFQRRDFLNEFLQEMQAAGHALEGYRAAPDRALAFQTLARMLLTRKKDQDLERLLEEHGQGHAGDPWRHFYKGELHLLRKETEAADRAFGAALAVAPQQLRYSMRNGLFRARVQAGKTADTYRLMGPGSTVFEELAYLCLDEKNAGQLAALVEAHRKAEPDDPNLLGWDLEVQWLNQDYAGALRLLTDRREDLLALQRFRWKIEDYRVRCLVKLKKNEEAIRAAEALAKSKRHNPLPLVLAHAAQGDVQRTLAVMENQKAERFFVQSCYRDPDLGPLLRSEPFQPFRERYPEPKEEANEEP